MKRLYPGVYGDNKYIYTKNLSPGIRVYNERLVIKDGIEYRTWNPYRSKMAAAIKKNIETFPITKKSTMLYLGVSTGTTASHFSDIVIDGIIYGIDVAFKPMKHFVSLSKQRHNLIPIMANASKPETYNSIVSNSVDIIYQDISQKNQVDIFKKNMDMYKPHAGFLMIKSRSIDVSKKPLEVYKKVIDQLKTWYSIKDTINLDPVIKDHMFISVQNE